MKLKLHLTLLFIFSMSSLLSGQEKPIYSVYLIGDTGDPELTQADPVLTHLKKHLDEESKKSSIIFLGDNIYHNGLPPKGIVEERENRIQAEKKLLVQLKALDNFKGEIYFIPGNHDWNDANPDGLDYIRAQEEYIEFFLDRGDVLIPDHGCPGPEKKKLGKKVVLLAMDSQWWLHPHTDSQSSSSACKNKNFDDIIQELREHLDENEDKQIIIALHHPIYSDGSHNGYFTLKDHVFPLTGLNSSLWIPLPGLGSLYPFFRTTFGAKQDMAHPLYQRLRDEILVLLEGRRNVVLASGHEHNLQYFFEKDNHFIKSGSGSKSAPLPKRNDAVFSSKEKGFAKLEYHKKGVVRLKYFTIVDGKEIESFNQIILESSPDFGESDDSFNINTDPITLPASEKYNKKGFHRFIFGNLYREDWSTPVSFRSLDLSLEKGGLEPKKIGGGMSSLSIRLRDNDKKEYVLRSVEKGVSKVVPKLFKKSVVQDIFQDQISASQPYAALIIPPLADAIGVHHTNPDLVYLPKQPLLGDYNDTYGDNLYLFEERPSGNREDLEEFGNSKKIVSYTRMLEKIRSDHGHHIHQEQVLKSRLFDFYLGDWDRHDDQWRWASFKEKHHDTSDEIHTYYEPIPRDRDQALFRYEGFMPWIARLLSPELRKFQTFGQSIKNPKYLAYNARHFDRTYLNELELDDWKRISSNMVENLTDDAISTALDQLPKPIQNLRRDEYRKAFSERKRKLVEYSIDYYKFVSKYVDVVGSTDDEIFEITYRPEGSIDIDVFQTKKDEHKDLFYHRKFQYDETKEIRLYGLAGQDQFILNEEHKINNKGPVIRIIGGKDDDSILRDFPIDKPNNKVFVYDDIIDQGMNPIGIGKDNRSNDYMVNNYDRKEFYYNSSVGIPILGFNPDNGLTLNYTHSFSTYGFRKKPYGTKHDVSFGYASNTDQLSIDYVGHFVDVLGKTDVELEVIVNLPDNVNNFFGLTNAKTFSVSEFGDFDYFRYNQTDVHFHPTLLWSSKREISVLKLGPFFRHVDVRPNENKFVKDFRLSGLSDESFAPANYIGIETEYKLTKIDNPSYPTVGIDFELVSSYNHNLNSSTERFSRVNASLNLYNFLWIPKPFVLATKVEAGINWGEFNFNQAQYVGLDNGLRGFRNDRFGGRSSFAVSNDLRLRIGKMSGALPLTFGLIGAYDIGRVWNEGEVENRWHRSYGGGFFISPFDVLPISVYYMKSTEETNIFLIRFGFAI